MELIEPQLYASYAPFRFAFENLNYFYAVPSTNYVSDGDFLYIEIKIPLTVMASNYHVYKVYSVLLL